MIKKSLLLTLLMALLVPWAAQAQETLTVHAGTETSRFVPFYGYYADDAQTNQMIYPATELADMAGGEISAMMLYWTNGNYSGGSGVGTWTISIGETSATTLSGLDNTTSLTQVFTGGLDALFNSNNTLPITFDNAYTYNGGNLLVQFSHSASSYKDYAFYGETVTGASYCYNSQRNFLPKTTFTYEPAATGGCEKPDALMANGEPTDTEFSFTIVGGSGLYNIFTKAGDGDWTNWEYEWEETTVNLSNLEGNTAYQVRVQSVCTDMTDPETGDAATSGWKTLSFTTKNPCATPTNLTVSDITAESATLSWTAGYQETEWTVKYKKSSDAWDDAVTITATSPSITLTGLDDNTTYNVQVYNCENYVSASFTTLEVCPDGMVCIGSGSATNVNLPLHNYYKYSLTEQIYTTAELGAAGAIESIDFYKAATIETVKTIDIYMVSTTKSEFTGNTDWINVTAADLVFSGTVTFADNDWTTIVLDNPFIYDGLSNVALVVDNNTGSYKSNTAFLTFSTGATYQALYYSSDSQNLDPTNVTQSGTRTYSKNRIRVAVGEPPACLKPTGLTASNVTAHEATITWTSDAAAWEIQLDNETPVEVSDTATYTFDGLDAETTYSVKVRANCGGIYSEWANVSFTTSIACPVPTSFATSNVGAHSVTLDWTSDASEWVVAYQAAADTTFSEVTVTEKPYVLEGLDPETSYTVKVKAVCGGIDGESQYTTTRSFTTTEACPAPGSLTVSNLTATGATLTWTELGEGTSWFICLDGDEENLIETHETTYTFTELESETVHTVKVKSDCSTNWSSVVEFEPTAKIIIGSGTATSTYLPSNTNYDYSFTQQIYTVAELGDAGVFESIDFYMTSTTAYTRNLDIYMVSTNKNAFESNTDWIAVTDADLVFSGDVDFVPQAWTTITLDNIFIYDGTQNVAIIVDDNTYGYSSRSFRTFTASAQQAIYKYQDGTNIPIDYTGNGTRTTSKNQIRILKSEMSDCMKPTSLTATEVAPNFAKLSWTENGESTEWVVVYNGNTITANTNVDFELTGLESDSVYTIAVYPTCDENLVSTAITITTLVACPTPFDVETVNIGHDNATVAWTGYSDNYNVKLGWDGEPTPTLVDFEDGVIPMQFVNDASYAWTIVTADTITYIMCGNQGVNSSTSAISVTVTYTVDGTIEFDAECRGEGTSTYYDHCDFYIDDERVLYHGADVTNEGWLHYSFDVAAGEHTFTWSYTKDSSVSNAGDYFAVDNIVLPLSAIVWSEPDAVEDTEYTFTGLTPETPYYVRVQGVCGETETEWSEIATFTTQELIYWNDSTDWTVPEEYADVTIPENTTVIVPAGYTAYADEITIEGDGQIIMEPGAQLYHSNEVPVALQMNVEGYGRDNGGYVLIAAPAYTNEIDNTLPVDGTNLNTGEFDLYAFDQSYPGAEWRNFKAGEFDALTLGQGYLYANSEDINNIVFNGQTMPTNATFSKALVYNNDSVQFPGWNLVGNPFTCMAYVDRPFYTMSAEGDAIVEVNIDQHSVEVMQGIFVVAESEDDNMIFTTTEPQPSAKLTLNLSQGRGIIDRAIVRFDEGRLLPKFQLNPSLTKVYFPMDGKDYAVVRSEEVGELPVNFKAETDGTYNLSFTTEEVSFNYLHLIDNMTGADVDLLETPSYTFEARSTDYANRFKLVFAMGTLSVSENFAFFSNGNLLINNEGEATVQVIDINGRILSSETINGSANINVNGAAGVYMIRLINGENVRVQKVVVR